jgi:hypothetical protein
MMQPGGPMPPREPQKEWILSIVTFGIYGLIWFHRVNKEMQAWSNGRIDYNPGASLSALLLGGFACGIPVFIAYASFAERVRTAQGMAGLPQDATFGNVFLRALLLQYHVNWLQERFNAIGQRPPQY